MRSIGEAILASSTPPDYITGIRRPHDSGSRLAVAQLSHYLSISFPINNRNISQSNAGLEYPLRKEEVTLVEVLFVAVKEQSMIKLVAGYMRGNREYINVQQTHRC